LIFIVGEKLGRSKHILADNNITKLLIKLSLPATVGMLIMAFYNLVDTIFVGRGVGTLAIGGVSIVFPYQMIVLALGHLLGIGSASIISRCLGANDRSKAERTLGNVYVMVLLMGITITVLGTIFLDPLLIAFGATASILPYAHDYLQIILLSTIFFLFLVVSNNVIRSEGRARIAMGTMIVSAVMNIILDPIFIFILKMGVRGAAIATLISQFLASLYIIYFFISSKSSLHFSFSQFKIDVKILKEIFTIGFSAFARNSAGSIVVILINNTLKNFNGDVSIPVFGIIHRLLRFVIMPIAGIAQGYQPILGYNFGAQNYRNILKTISRGVIISTIIAYTGFIILFLFPKPLLSIFTSDQELIRYGVFALRLIILALPTEGFQVIGATTFQALGKPVPAFFLSVSHRMLFFVPLMLILPSLYGASGVWIAFPVSDLLTLLLTIPLLYRETGKFKKRLIAS
jgi:MATE family, multidrug efflux pump